MAPGSCKADPRRPAGIRPTPAYPPARAPQGSPGSGQARILPSTRLLRPSASVGSTRHRGRRTARAGQPTSCRSQGDVSPDITPSSVWWPSTASSKTSAPKRRLSGPSRLALSVARLATNARSGARDGTHTNHHHHLATGREEQAESRAQSQNLVHNGARSAQFIRSPSPGLSTAAAKPQVRAAGGDVDGPCCAS